MSYATMIIPIFVLFSQVCMSDPHYVRIDFNTLEPSQLEGLSGGTGFADSSTWDSGSTVIWVRSGDLVPPAPASGEYVPSQFGTPRLMQGTFDKPRQQSRDIAVPMEGIVWFSFLVRQHAAHGAGGIGFNQSISWHVRPNILAVGRDLKIQYPDNASDITVPNVFVFGETALVVGKIAINAGPGGQDHISVWVNPDVTEPGDPLVSQATADFVGDAISRLCLISYGGAGAAISGELDEVVLSNYPYPDAYYHVTPRLRFKGPHHIPVQIDSEITSLPPDGYELVFSDEFEGNALDESQWNYRTGSKEYSTQLPENVEVSDGKLIIHLRKEQAPDSWRHYTGGGVHSKETFVYGYYESRFKVPSAEGWHTSFWTFPAWDMGVRGSEIDFCEQDSGDPYLYSFGVIDHTVSGWNNRNVGRWVIEDAPPMTENYVVVSAEFTPDYLRFYINGRLKKEMDSGTFPHVPMDVRLTSIATRKKGDRFQDDAGLPDKAVFDYVRVYQHPQYREAEETIYAGISPVIEHQPQRTAAFPGEMATFSVAAKSFTPITSYQWYKSDDKATNTPDDDVLILSGPEADVLTIENVALLDEGYYYCVVTNDAGSIVSQAAVLGVKRLMAHWPMGQADTADGHYLDLASGYDAVITGEPSFAGGADGTPDGAAVISANNGWAVAGNWDPMQKTGLMSISLWADWYGMTGTVQRLLTKANLSWNAEDTAWTIGNPGTGNLQGIAFIAPPPGNDSAPLDMVADGAFQHYVVTYDGFELKVYLDGNLMLRDDADGEGFVINHLAADALIGIGVGYAGDGRFAFNGALDDIRIYNYDLSPHEVGALYFDVTGQPGCVHPPEFDLTGDCRFDLQDLVIIIRGWLDCGLYPESECF